jgi:hypothetical protein
MRAFISGRSRELKTIIVNSTPPSDRGCLDYHPTISKNSANFKSS